MYVWRFGVWIAFLALTFFPPGLNSQGDARLSPGPDDIVVANPGIKVPFGRKYMLDPQRDLRIVRRARDWCQVKVLGNTDRLQMWPGRLWPSSFPCDFLPDTVTYTHLGGREPTEDRIRLQVRYHSPTDTIIVPFTIEVDVSFVQLEVVTKNMPVTVGHTPGALSETVDSSKLQFTYNRSRELCRVTVMDGVQSLPRYGKLAADGQTLTGVDCDEFLKLGIKYTHTSSSRSASRDSIPMTVEVVNLDGTRMRQEYFQVPVRIRGGSFNTPPVVADGSTLLLEVNQFIMTALTPQIVAGTDEGTPPGNLIFNITKPPGQGEGTIVSTADSSLPLNSFSQRDLQDLNIAYKPPNTKSRSQRIIQVHLQIVDEEGAKSDEFPLSIVVNPMRTLAPKVTRNTGIQLFEGQSRPLTSHENLQISDEDDLDNVRVKVVDGLRHGQLQVNGVKAMTFTPADLDRGVVRYVHDHSDTYSDNIIFRMTDGHGNSVEFLFPVTIFPEDDQAPVLNVNIGLVLDKNLTVPITSHVLSATDVDSDDYSIMYTLEQPYNREAVFTKRQLQVPADPTYWRRLNGFYEKPVVEWTQEDIIEGRIYYQHRGSHQSAHMTVDRIRFRVKDNAVPPNESEIHEFIVQVTPIDDQPPKLYAPSISLRMTVNENEMAPITRRQMRYTDTFANDRVLRYTVVTKPADTDVMVRGQGGSIVLCNDPSTEVKTFTQAQVNHHKVCYLPPNTEIGVTPHIIQFVFKVEDPAGNALTGQTFTVYLRPVNNQSPIVMNSGLTVNENGNVVLSLDTLDVLDADTPEDQLRLVVVQVPRYGQLTLDGTPVQRGQTLSREYIRSGRLAYRNTGVEMDRDRFHLDVTDGVHHVPVTVTIQVKSVDDERPSIELPQGKLGVTLTVHEGGSVTITGRDVRAHDPDTDDALLIFTVQGGGPSQGAVLLNNQPTETFRQQDILDGRVRYVHTAGEIGPQQQRDIFNLTITDRSDNWVVNGNKLTGFSVAVIVLPLDNRAPRVRTSGVFKVQEASRATIDPTYLRVTDEDSKVQQLWCQIMKQPQFGYLENVSPPKGSERSRAGSPIQTFSVIEQIASSINYVQALHRGVEPREDNFMIRCSDAHNNTSPEVIFPIVIEPVNDEVPKLYVHPLIVQEGKGLVLELPILNAVDLDEPSDDLLFTVTRRPIHGLLLRQSPTLAEEVTEFRLTDLREGPTIKYEHDNTETTKDSFRLLLSDGLHRVERDVGITVVPVDDETPRLVTNTGLGILPGQIVAITNEELKATDLDSLDTNLTFIVRRAPVYGFLQLETRGGRQNLTNGMSFTQEDIDRETVRYHHMGRPGMRDLIKLDVTDGHNPLIDRYFYVTIDDADLSYPVVVNHGVELPEGGVVTLTTDLLSTSDSQTPVSDLRFTITRPPEHGFLENVDHPSQPLSTFTQLQLAGSKIRYVHIGEDEVSMDSFEFEVTDGQNHVWRTLRISVTPVDNRKPVLMLERLHVLEGGVKVITPFELRAVDSDTDDNKLEFWVTRHPLHGQILFNLSESRAMFTMADINANLITYKHDGSETTKDSFQVRITDGTHYDFFVFPETMRTSWEAQDIQVEITPVDNGMPYLVTNAGGTELLEFAGLGTGVEISTRVLEAEDRDSLVDRLLYTVTKPPKHGDIINIHTGQTGINEWTQGEMKSGWIVYLLRPGVNVTYDVMQFSITDTGGNVLEGQVLDLRWAWLSLEADTFTVEEGKEILTATIKRRGCLDHTVFVTVEVLDGTAVSDSDFVLPSSNQVQLAPGETEKAWRVVLISDGIYEATEYFTLQLRQPIRAGLEVPYTATVTINDIHDESVVSTGVSLLEVEEGTGEALIPLVRTGDVSNELQVICHTHNGTAVGTVPHTVTSFSDYITRPFDHFSIIRFDKSQHTASCPVTVIDDSLYETDETFTVYLAGPLGGLLGGQNHTKVVILADLADEPVIYFGESSYHVDESSREVKVMIWRSGTDLQHTASVTVRSRPGQPTSAQVGLDYVGVHQTVRFESQEQVRQVVVSVLDDVGVVTLEGVKSLELVLTMPMNASLGNPSLATIVINDSSSDLPQMEFRDDSYVVSEVDGHLAAVVVRRGDLGFRSSVRCFTRQGSATVSADFTERPDTDQSRVFFQPGQREAKCVVEVTADGIHEDDEQLHLVLGSPDSSAPGGASLGQRTRATITITDSADKSVITFGETRLTVSEPRRSEDVTRVSVPVLRLGDTRRLSAVRVHTRDGTATAGEDYVGFSKELVFGPDVRTQIVEVEVLHDNVKELREAFSLLLTHDRYRVSTIRKKRAVVYIEELDRWADVTFPAPPIVVSLRYYDNVNAATGKPPSGYPLVCVTACDPRHPDFASLTRGVCEQEGVNNSMSEFRWRLAPPAGRDGIRPGLLDLETSVFFASVRMATLDSVFFGPGSRVQCVARAVDTEGRVGREIPGNVVTISNKDSTCPPRIQGSIGAEPFAASIKYEDSGDEEHTNTILITVVIPHQDGLVPAVSTRPITNLDLALSQNAFRLAQHGCSNLLNPGEGATGHGFVDGHQGAGQRPYGFLEPYEASVGLRGNDTVDFYRSLDLESCTWRITGYFTVSELLAVCGATGSAVGQVLNLMESFTTVHVPLYVSYIYYAPQLLGHWTQFDFQTDLHLTFVYNSAILWKQGLAPSGPGHPQGRLFPMKVAINGLGQLIVRVRTETLFYGQFVPSYPGTSLTSTVSCPHWPEKTFTLRLQRSDPTFSQPKQTWTFTSDVAVADYTCDYEMSMVPCLARADEHYSLPLRCRPGDPVLFTVPLQLQQVDRSIGANFTLNANLHVLKKRSVWLTGGATTEPQDEDVVFTADDVIYSLVTLDESHDLGDHFSVNIEKVFLCTGQEGHIPRYEPSDGQYGCLGPAPQLLHSIKILDRGAPLSVLTRFQDADFMAQFAEDDPGAADLTTRPSADGFSLSAAPLFKVSPGHPWFVHAIYTVQTGSRLSGRRRKRAVGQVISDPYRYSGHTLGHSRHQLHSAQARDVNVSRDHARKTVRHVSLGSLDGDNVIIPAEKVGHARKVRATADVNSKPSVGTGTNMVVIALDHSLDAQSNHLKGGSPLDGIAKEPLVAGLSVAIIVLVTVVLVTVTVRRYRNSRSSDDPSTGAAPAHSPPVSAGKISTPTNQGQSKVTQV